MPDFFSRKPQVLGALKRAEPIVLYISVIESKEVCPISLHSWLLLKHGLKPAALIAQNSIIPLELLEKAR